MSGLLFLGGCVSAGLAGISPTPATLLWTVVAVSLIVLAVAGWARE